MLERGSIVAMSKDSLRHLRSDGRPSEVRGECCTQSVQVCEATFRVNEARGFEVDTCELERALGRGYDLVVLVNPNSPTGRILSRDRLEGLLSGVSARTRVWVDETYMEYVGPEQSLEKFAARSEHIVICKSMSKCYALSGARVGYLCAGAHQLEALRAVTPPWVVSLPAQVAAVEALRDPKYYAARYAQTRQLRSFLDAELRSIGIETFPGVANFLLCRLPADGPDAATLVARCRERDVFIRDAAQMGSRLGARFVRIAVKDADTNVQILHAVSYGLGVQWRGDDVAADQIATSNSALNLLST